ncbi:MAG TPA: histidine phosphatase family protein [Candidatus Binatia bacterium]|nr:histidine phosphatase family protein [Candidatus Binatia bacterium]
MLLLLVRHGVTQHNTDRIFMGHDPVPLAPAGREQIRRLAERLAASPPTRIVSSDIARARESAEILAQRLRLPIESSAELREVDVGDAKGFSYADAATRWPEVFNPDGLGRFPGGESFAGVADRATAYLRSVVTSDTGTVLVVTHGGVVRGVLARLLGLPLEAVAGFLIDNASLSIFRIEAGVTNLVTWNDTAHIGLAAAGGQWPGDVGG